jgi:hypothetical protein
MTNADLGLSPFQEPPSVAVQPAAKRAAWWPRIEAVLERASEWLNPILVKESRQALKSRQFIVTFTLLLVFGWGWSLAGVAMLSQAAYYAPGGRFMLAGYFIILAVPLIVIVPFSAFRSLAAEREDGTFELLSITTLRARQIISGKLGSAIVQMAVYYSALAPCIAFTYLLRGIDVLTIGLMLLYTFLASILLSQLGLIAATITRSPHWQILLSVLLILFLAWCDVIGSYAMVMGMIYAAGSIEFDNFYFWIAHVAILTFYVSFVALLLYAAAAQISFASDNRSTVLRIIMLIQQLLWVGWMTYVWVETNDSEILYVVVTIGSLYWFFAGSLLCGESGQLSPRVKRSLPQSFLGRALFTWFNPGSGTGYMFAVLNVWSLTLFVGIAGMIAEIYGNLGAGNFPKLFTASTLCASYMTAYVGVGRLLVMALRQRYSTGLILPMLINVVFALLGIFAPLVFSGWLTGFSSMDYSGLQLTNWAWTIVEAVDGTLWGSSMVPILVYFVAACVLAVNLFVAMREVEQVRLATPHRVLEDEWQLHPEKAPASPRRKNPWE